MIILSIISHSSASEIVYFIKKNKKILDRKDVKIVIRINKVEPLQELEETLTLLNFSEYSLQHNKEVYGFGKNHNLNFRENATLGDIFIVCNPDITELSDNIFDEVLAQCDNSKILTPKIFTAKEKLADYRRKQISLWSFFLRFFWKKIGVAKNDCQLVWFPSVFKCFTYEVFSQINGYDEEIIMYYEDYDICMRGSAAKIEPAIMLRTQILHPANRSSRKNITLFMQHVKSFIFVWNRHRKGFYL